jgi:tyrosinase
MHPNSYLTPFPDNYGSYTLQGGGHNNDTISTPLEPFSTDIQGNFYTTSGSQSLRTFGYSYAEIQDWSQAPEQLQANVTAQVNSLYSSSATQVKRNVLEPRIQIKEWSVAISVSKFDLGGQRFVIRIFLGDIPQNPLDWSVSDACVGSFPVLPPVSPAARAPHQVLTHNEISLTEGLKARGYDGQDSTTTAKYLERSLQWKVQLVRLAIRIPS